MEQIIEVAAQLGKLLADHPRTKAFLAAMAQVQQDSQAKQLLNDHHAQATKIRQLEANLKPVEVPDKRKLADLEARMAGNELLKHMTRCQADYLQMMHEVHTAMETPLTPAGP